MFDLIPLPYRMLAIVGAIVVLCAISASTAWTVNGWRLNSKFADAIAAKDAVINDRDAAITEQNHKVEILEVKTTSAERARNVAEANAKVARDISIKRLKSADAIVATNCNSMLEKLKGVSK